MHGQRWLTRGGPNAAWHDEAGHVRGLHDQPNLATPSAQFDIEAMNTGHARPLLGPHTTSGMHHNAPHATNADLHAPALIDPQAERHSGGPRVVL